MMKIVFLASFVLGKVAAEFGDYADPTFDCPATTTCPQVCVQTADECPPEMQCGEFEMLCADGSCADFCDPTLISPCGSQCAPVACPKVITTYDVCQTNYTLFYEFEATCESIYEEIIHEGASFGWTHPACIVVYVWIVGVTLGIVAWCWFK